MKHVWHRVRRASVKVSVSASVAAGAVAVMASPAAAENRPGPFETEFDLDLAPAAAAINAPAAQAPTLDVASASAKWEESIGQYLDGLLDSVTPGVQAGQLTQADAASAIAVIEAEVKAFAAAEGTLPAGVPDARPEVRPLPPEVLEALGIDPADAGDGKAQDVLIAVPAEAKAQAAAHAEPAANPLLLAPVLSHPIDCELCREAGKSVQTAKAEPVDPAPAEARVDDMAAWQTLAEWASARVLADEGSREDDDVASLDGDDVERASEDPALAN